MGNERDSQNEPSSDNGGSKKHTAGIPPLEWAVAIFGAILVIATLGYLVYLTFDRQETSPPELNVTVQQYNRLETGHLIVFEVYNRGERAVSQVHIEGVLRDGESDVETSEATLDYVPSESVRSGGLFFANNPGDYTLVLRALGYQNP